MAKVIRQVLFKAYKDVKFVRPNLHLTSPYGWLNDPCAPCYDPKTQLYHLFYQCNPNGVEWGDMSWGHATSKDLLKWDFSPVHTVLRPDERYDKDGVFTGCMVPPDGGVTLEIFYSSICKLPFHWTSPAPRGSAGLSMATSTDGGVTWTKSNENPIIGGEPHDVEVTGFRDPYVAEWPALDELRGKKSLYGLISGGIQKVGPTTFIYAIGVNDRSSWEYLGPLVNIPERFQPSPKWECNYGINWECVNFMTLKSDSTSAARDFLILGSEGDVDRDHVKTYNLPPLMGSRTTRHQQWMCGRLAKSPSDQIEFKYQYGGILDHGCYYAANSFYDPKTQRQILHGWIPEEDSSANYCKRKGWNGSLSIPRELFLQSIPNVTGTVNSPLEQIASIEVARQADHSNIVHTMGIRPIIELQKLRTTARQSYNIPAFTLSSDKSSKQSIRHLATTTTPTWELTATIAIQHPITTQRLLGFFIRHSPDRYLATRTKVHFSIADETIVVNRLHSIDPESPASRYTFNLCDDLGPFTLFTTTSSSSTQPTIEKLHLRIISDGDVLEVFANDRFALGTMLYTGEFERCGGISAVVEGDGSAIFEEVNIWDGLNGGNSLIGSDGDWEVGGGQRKVEI